MLFRLWEESPNISRLDKGGTYMNSIILICSCIMLISSTLVVLKQAKEKKPISDPYLILAILSFLVSLTMIISRIF